MRVVCTCIPAPSRFLVVAPLARAIAAAGHDVAFAVPASFQLEASAAGFHTLVAGLSLSELREAARGAGGEPLPPDRAAALMFTRLAPLALRKHSLDIFQAYAPDVIVHEEGEFGGPLIAAMLGIPSVVTGWPCPLRSPEQLRQLDAALASTWIEAGLAPAVLGGMYDSLFLDTCPPSLQSAHAALVSKRHQMRPLLDQTRSGTLEEPLRRRVDGLPTVHLTFGTVLPLASDTLALVRRIVEALRSERLRLVVAVGDRNDPEIVGSAHERLIVGRYWPHRLLLPQCDAVICHGGAGSTVAALSHGLPLLVLPQHGASQFRSALACAKAGAGLTLVEDEIDEASIRAAVATLVCDDAYRLAAQRIAAEIELMPAPAQLVHSIESVAAVGRAQ